MRVAKKQLIVGFDVSSGNKTGDPINTEHCVVAGVQYVVASGVAPTGTLKLQGTYDGTNWLDISGATASITTNGTGEIKITDAPYLDIRPVYTKTSGTGTLDVYAIAKGV